MTLTTTLQKVEALYIAYFGRAGDPSGVSYWVEQMDIRGKTFAELAGYFATQSESTVAYPYLVNPALADPASFVTQVYHNLFARPPELAGVLYWVTLLNTYRGNPAFVGQVIDYIIGGASPADAAVLENKVAAGIYFTQVVATKGLAITGPDGKLTAEGADAARTATGPLVTGDPASVAASKLVTDAFDVTTAFHLTTATDNIIGTGGTDIITAGALAPNGTTAATTLNALDTINGGGGIDTLVVDTTGNQNATIQGTITNVENLTVVGTGALATVNAAPFSGIVKFQQTSDTAFVVENLNAQTVAFDRVAFSTQADLKFGATQTSVNLIATNNPGTIGFNIATGAALKTVNLMIDKTASGEQVNLFDASSSVENVNITTPGASTVLISAGELKNVTLKGAGAVSLSGVSPADSIDASGNTGGVQVTNTLANSAIFIGGSGNDSIAVTANTRAVTLGAGDDKVNFNSPVLGLGGSLDGGAGFDTINLSITDAVSITASKATGDAFAASISNFERLEISPLIVGTVAIDAQYLDGINSILSAGSSAVTSLTINNLATNATFESTAPHHGAVALNLKDTSGTSDVVNLKFTSTTGYTNTDAITVNGVETLNIVTTDTDTTAPASWFTATILADAVKSMVVSGNVGIHFSGGLSADTLTSFDASGVTATGINGSVSFNAGALTNAAVAKGGAGDDLLNFLSATKGVTVDGGGGNDTIHGTVVADTILGGAGDDIITSGTGLDILTGGAGKDTFHLVANSNGNIYATITDASAGDVLNFKGIGVTLDTFNKVKVGLADTAVFQDYLNEAAKADGSVNGNISWFQFGGNTYVVEDLSAGATFANGTDIVVKLTGLVDVSTANIFGNHGVTLA